MNFIPEAWEAKSYVRVHVPLTLNSEHKWKMPTETCARTQADNQEKKSNYVQKKGKKREQRENHTISMMIW